MVKTISKVIILSFLGFSLTAQHHVDLLKTYYAISPNNVFDTASAKTDVVEYGAEILLPIALENGNAIITGITYDKTTLKPGPLLKSPVHLYTINPRIGANITHSKKWTGLYVLLPQLASDLKNIDGDDFQIGAISILTYKKNERLKYKIGAYYNSALYGPGLFAILGFYYESPNDLWTFDFSLPIYADINYKINNALSSGIHFDAKLRSYYLNEPVFDAENEYIVKSSQELLAYVQFDIAKNFIFQLQFGRSFFRSYRVFEEGDKIDLGFSGINFGDKRDRLSTDFADGMILQFRLHYRFYLKSIKEELPPPP